MADFDGWDDDDDLDLDIMDEPVTNNVGNVGAGTQTDPQPEQDANNDDGWDDGWPDDDLADLSTTEVNDDNAGAHDVPVESKIIPSDYHHQESSSHPPSAPPVPDPVGTNGWGADDDDLFSDDTPKPAASQEGWGDDDDMFSESSNVVQPSRIVAAPPPPPPPPPPSKPTLAAPVVEPETSASGGWDDDDLDGLDVSESNANSTNQDQSGWGDDDDLFLENDVSDAIRPTNSSIPVQQQQQIMPSQPSLRPQSAFYQELRDYLDMLPHLGPSIGAIFQAEYNIPEKASELVAYYDSRPALVEYTIEKELPRMTYTLMEPQPNDAPPKEVKDRPSIALAMAHDPTLTTRCANQSLLADALQVMTGRDRLIRSQYLATAVATSCRFQVDICQSWVECDAQLDMVIPTEQGQWKVADLDLHISIVVDPTAPFVEYCLQGIRPVPRDDDWEARLQSAASMLESMDLPDADEEAKMQQHQETDFRDVFLQNSQAALQNYAVGMRTALQEIDKVSGVSDKIKNIPGFLPDDLMQAAEEAPVSPPKERPQSLLGGFVRQLAKTVTLPEEVPGMYDDWKQDPETAGQHKSSHVPKLYGTPDAKAPAGPNPFQQPGSPHIEAQRDIQKDVISPNMSEKSNVTETSSVSKHPISTASATLPSPLRRKKEVYRRSDGPEEAFVPNLEGNTAKQKPPGGRVVQSSTNNSKGNFPTLYRREEPEESPRTNETTRSKSSSPTIQLYRKQDQTKVAETSLPPTEWAKTPDIPAASKETIEDPPSFAYDPVTGIAPTRRRWVNPRPGIRCLSRYYSEAS